MAGQSGVEHLEEEGPEEGDRQVKALALGLGIECFGYEVRRQRVSKYGGQIGQRQRAELMELADDAA